ncbi:hypothetical protein Bbelb_014440 [Branchiostoma belcheri]|nr:hypothetical protein Bbelb_014440 [Branchiostoma belcheri]
MATFANTALELPVTTGQGVECNPRLTDTAPGQTTSTASVASNTADCLAKCEEWGRLEGLKVLIHLSESNPTSPQTGQGTCGGQTSQIDMTDKVNNLVPVMVSSHQVNRRFLLHVWRRTAYNLALIQTETLVNIKVTISNDNWTTGSHKTKFLDSTSPSEDARHADDDTTWSTGAVRSGGGVRNEHSCTAIILLYTCHNDDVSAAFSATFVLFRQRGSLSRTVLPQQTSLVEETANRTIKFDCRNSHYVFRRKSSLGISENAFYKHESNFKANRIHLTVISGPAVPHLKLSHCQAPNLQAMEAWAFPATTVSQVKRQVKFSS